MTLVSIYTVGRLNHPLDYPNSREFFQVGNEIYRQATKTGLIEAFSPEGAPFPEETIKGNGSSILTLTVWRNLHSLYRFTYSGQHMEALEIEADGSSPIQRNTFLI
ncbi:DUF3291 domain-containing protein [Neobacillus fumarioli]|uniref:DUF3291 domain-containing protein n=1 Tax=Neobacillus fumarioli TaxID=105229 RepID=UPI000AE2EA38|nr:DUF3291 domain-containing protein [Neobacillus fumarioli]